MTDLLARIVLFPAVLLPLLVVHKAQGRLDASSTLRAALRALPAYTVGFLGVAAVMLALQWLFVD